MSDFCKPLLDYISSVVDLDGPATDNIVAHAREVSFPRGSMLFTTGETARHAYFIVSGHARSYYTDYTGKTVTWLFHFNEPFSHIKNLFVVDYKSFLTDTPGTMSIEALSDIKMIRLGRHMFDNENQQAPALETFMRILNEKAFVVLYDKIYTLITKSATQRYLKILKEEPFLTQMFSNHYLASYLGIAPQSLSRIRARLMHTSA
ncbi:cAMP-binding domain of CRP or a regulatory subunit of cAMP-dependent protein kinases [Pedobacter westerhofensis]|uniref:cAMP-binding domain of CRP or a regulatory subunit of cAMP-dependent protein kinases n=1 Tax=Pedobacter westerhofensis TaxID=425512 RepID=A0A521BPH7_9SPHI|nr:Crp/Fnr family transcriptional regulator [Pedobacter westerhofensis]SMO48975.1 cAMP-binding domain of CRP or a regulatory subunit of cAMP-dependent protein kinases [Pedobacter westerhofensis]